MREALRTLEEAGLIARASPKIMVVRRAGDDRVMEEVKGALTRRNVTFHHLHEALLVFEPELTRLAALRADAADLERLDEQLAAQAESLDDVPEFCRLDQVFHLGVAELSANPALVMARAPISDLLAPIMETFMAAPSMTRRSLDFHRRIAEEIRVRDADAAALMARKHVNDLRACWQRRAELRAGDRRARCGAGARLMRHLRPVDFSAYRREGYEFQHLYNGESAVVIGSNVPAGAAAPPHHTHPIDQLYYIVSGEMHVQLGSEEFFAGPDTLVFIPSGVPHHNWNTGTADEFHFEVLAPAPIPGREMMTPTDSTDALGLPYLVRPRRLTAMSRTSPDSRSRSC